MSVQSFTRSSILSMGISANVSGTQIRIHEALTAAAVDSVDASLRSASSACGSGGVKRLHPARKNDAIAIGIRFNLFMEI